MSILARRLNIPAILAFALLAFQVSIPWTSRYYLTQDGPSHLYTAVVARDLLRADSPYASVYTFHPDFVSNWGTAVLFNTSLTLVGPMYAERVIATLCILLGFFGIGYFLRSLDPRTNPWSPLINFLLNTWFLWIGFYNFYLGMALCPFVVGYYIRHSLDMTWRRVAIIAVSLVMLFFTHVLPVGLSVMTIGLVGIWTNLFAPFFTAPSRRPLSEIVFQSSRPLVALFAAIVPAGLLCASFLRTWDPATVYDPAIEWAWSIFPMHVFASSRGRIGEQLLLYPAILFFIGVGILGLRRREWATAKGAVAIAAGMSFALYLIMPNAGFAADEIKIRLSWAFFLLGAPLAYSAARTRRLRTPVSIYIACFLAFNLFHAMRHNVRRVRHAIHLYASAMESIPPGSTFVRIRFPNQNTRDRFGFGTLALDPLLHLDSWVAARRRLIALTDYQTLTRTFPVVFKPNVSIDTQYQLWDLENDRSETTVSNLNILLKQFPVTIDYVVVTGDGTPGRESELKALLSDLNSTMRQVGADPENAFIRVFQRLSAASPTKP